MKIQFKNTLSFTPSLGSVTPGIEYTITNKVEACKAVNVGYVDDEGKRASIKLIDYDGVIHPNVIILEEGI